MAFEAVLKRFQPVSTSGGLPRSRINYFLSSCAWAACGLPPPVQTSPARSRNLLSLTHQPNFERFPPTFSSVVLSSNLQMDTDFCVF